MAMIAAQDIDYRNKARRSLERAKDELKSVDDERLPYAILELRFAMEAITYDRAQAFKDDLPYEEYSTWQPRILVAVLAGIDPSIMVDVTTAVNGKVLGKDFVLTAEDIKDHYEFLGSRLHIPSMAQFQKGKLPDLVKDRARCEEIVAIVDRVLSSKVWNNTLGPVCLLECFNCGKQLKRRMPYNRKSIQVVCFDCKAEYTVEDQGDGSVLWRPKTEEAPCANPACTGKIALFPIEIKPGKYWTCKECGAVSELQLRVGIKDADWAAS